MPDGSYLTEIFDQRDIHHTRPRVRVRGIEYTIAGHDDVYRLITTILNPTKAPATELAAVYARRWEFEFTLDESKTHLGGTHLVLRSRHPDGAEQELYGFLLVHHAIRHLMHEAAADGDTDPDRISFTLTPRGAPPGPRPSGVFPRKPRLRHQAHAPATTTPAPPAPLKSPRHQAEGHRLAP